MADEFSLNCPLPLNDHATVQMAHGGGGRVMRKLIAEMFLPAFDDRPAEARSAPHDSAVLPAPGGRIAMTTDTFVVSPLFFPGGDIGKLAICGTVNDLAMSGARPLYLSAGFILEEGLPLETLRRVVESMCRTARQAGVRIVTGDTKVVDRGKGDGVFINTSGVGVVPDGIEVAPARVTPGDAVIVSGDLGRHGIAILSVRDNLQFEGALESDCDCLNVLVEDLLPLGPDLHCLRDLTRGGLAAALNEIADDVRVGIELDERTIPVTEPVSCACEMLGLDPLYVANEGRLVAFVPAAAVGATMEFLRRHPSAHQPAVIGRVVAEHPGTVVLRGRLGGTRILDLLSGEQMPRIC